MLSLKRLESNQEKIKNKSKKNLEKSRIKMMLP